MKEILLLKPIETKRQLQSGVVALLMAGLILVLPSTSAQGKEPDAAFDASWESLKKYECPEWFRDAKFGIWAHWGPQAVPLDGDWYARGMYEPGNKNYKHHLDNYGHPSEHGYKDIIPLWKAEKWDPDRLMALYKKAGAKYFVSMGSHHDNFSLWNDKFHRWNAVNMGPKRDVVGEWQKAAQKQGLKFGVSEHLAASYTWFQTSHGSDNDGPKAGVPYDGADPKFADLYHPKAEPGDNAWYSTNPAWQAEWDRRIRGLLDTYHPDLLYSDGGMPFGAIGRKLVADYYNASAARNGGRNQAVYNCKSLHGNTENNQFVAEACVPDVERGGMTEIQSAPWQTDTSIGDWFCNRNWPPRGADWVVRALVDIVSKNGNLLLNVELRPDGSLSQDVEKTVVDLGAWMDINGTAIHSTRPWLVFGEGPTRLKGGHFNDSFAFKPHDIRFTTKQGVLYAIAMGWAPDGRLNIRSLAKPNKIQSVKLLGYTGKLAWTQDEIGLHITLPEKKVSGIAIAFEIHGEGLKPVPIPVEYIHPDADRKITLTPSAAVCNGSGDFQVEEMSGKNNIGWWHDKDTWASWSVEFTKSGIYQVRTECSACDGDSALVLEVDGQKVPVSVAGTPSPQEYREVVFGSVEIKKAGLQEIRIRYVDSPTWKPVNLRDVTLTPKL